MVEKEVQVTNPTGLHARPASKLCGAAQQFSSKILVIVGDKVADAKSILNIMACGISQGTLIKVTAEGPDEVEALAAVTSFIENLAD